MGAELPGSSELLLQQYHVDAMGSAAWQLLHATGKAKVLPSPGVGKAIGDDELVRRT